MEWTLRRLTDMGGALIALSLLIGGWFIIHLAAFFALALYFRWALPRSLRRGGHKDAL